MPSSPSEFLAAADTFVSLGNEASYRAAVSRSYYAVYHHGLQTVSIKLPLTNGLVYSCPTHEKLYKKMLDGRTHEWRVLAYKVSDFKKERVEADYYLSEDVTVEDAVDAIAKAKALINEFDII